MSSKRIRLSQFFVLIGLFELSGCTTKEPSGETYVSPSGEFVIAVQIGDKEDASNKYEIFFRLLDDDGDQLDIARTKASAVMNYAVFWNTATTVVLYSSDIGVYAWRVTTDERLLQVPVDRKLEKKAQEIFNKKMGRSSHSQTDSSEFEPVPTPYPEYIVYRYDEQLQDTIASYNYSNKWDFDGDHKNDSLVFVGTGGAHSFFYLRIVLTTDHKTREFPFIELDMPYIKSFNDLKESGDNPGVQFVVHDFDADDIAEIYLNLPAPYDQIPKELKKLGVTSKQILVNCSINNLEIKNYKVH